MCENENAGFSVFILQPKLCVQQYLRSSVHVLLKTTYPTTSFASSVLSGARGRIFDKSDGWCKHCQRQHPAMMPGGDWQENGSSSSQSILHTNQPDFHPILLHREYTFAIINGKPRSNHGVGASLRATTGTFSHDTRIRIEMALDET